MNLKEIEKARRLLRDRVERTEVCRTERTHRGRKIQSWCLSVAWRGGGQQVYFCLDDIKQKLDSIEQWSKE